MNKKVLIVEDQFVEANDLQLMLKKAGYEVCGIARSVDIAEDMLRKEIPGLVLLDIFLKGKRTGIELARQLKEQNIAFIYLSANSNEQVLSEAKKTEPYGFIVKPFREKDLLVTLEIAQYRHEHSHDSRYRRESELVIQLEKLSVQGILPKQKMLQLALLLQQHLPFDYLTFGFGNATGLQNAGTSFLRVGFNEYQQIGVPELSIVTGTPVDQLEQLLSSTKEAAMPAIFLNDEFEAKSQRPSLNKIASERFKMRSLLSFPITAESAEQLNICLYSRRPDSYSVENLSLLYRVQPMLMKILPIVPSKDARVTSEPAFQKNATVEHFKKNEPDAAFEGIIGRSHLLLNVFDQVTQVAPFDTAVLILGESGTGKERIASCIHNLSPRKDKPLIKLNCATLPATLIESELFGHEKGSFTGAAEKRKGKFELANGGTIFLDEIGEMPIDLQVKLLRVLQEKEIEPVGGKAPIKVNVRVVAATNRNLEKEVGEGRFRLDLYYRLNVFPISLPALRERKEDIPVLIDHFLGIYNRKAGKKILGVSDKVLSSMMFYSWPGNIRELENLVERCVLLAKGSYIEDLNLPASAPIATVEKVREDQPKTIHENEREYIINILKKCNGRIWGTGGAAEILNIPPSTLKSKMKKLGIPKQSNY